jgi:hypothetical protein
VARTPAQAEVEQDDEVVVAPQVRTGAPEVASDLTEDEVTNPTTLGFVKKQRPEVEIEAQTVPRHRPQVDPDGMVEVRMARTIEEFTYGNPHRHYHLEAGKRYRLPLHVAQYLDGLEAIHHRT